MEITLPSISSLAFVYIRTYILKAVLKFVCSSAVSVLTCRTFSFLFVLYIRMQIYFACDYESRLSLDTFY